MTVRDGLPNAFPLLLLSVSEFEREESARRTEVDFVRDRVRRAKKHPFSVFTGGTF